MSRHEIRFRVFGNAIEIVDPDKNALPLLQSLDPTFRIQTAPLPCFRYPKFTLGKKIDTGLTKKKLRETPTETLWELHKKLTRDEWREWSRLSKEPKKSSINIKPDVSLMELKMELAFRALASCTLCASACKVNRLAGETGACGLKTLAYVGEHFLHIAEEPPINPAYNLNLQGCGLRCKYCQQFKLLKIRPRRGEKLTEAFWGKMDLTEARSLAFVGGNPDESLYPILKFLAAAPENFLLPIVWNCHGYSTQLTLKLLDKVVDVFLPDFKYGNDACGEKLSGVKGYFTTVKEAIPKMISSGAFVIVRMLVLPGHIECCHKVALEFLANYREKLVLRLMPQYAPDFAITKADGELARRPTLEEFIAVFFEAQKIGLNLV